MTENFKPQPGQICWNELNASDLEAAKKFYSEVMGWTSQDMPDHQYTLFLHNGVPVAGYMDIAFIEDGDQIPPNWFVYLTVANMDEALAKVNSNGGAVMKEPFHVDNMGKIAIVVDAAKAVVGLVEPD
ncbi:MAG: VOC family protein [Rhodobacteraceae bacterium]|nr:VOC family protein [Paracoccaceae bacterium]MYF46984.1 VOC family protein [Paracoccaceae bacterium]MYI90772.1 VOC family protein [Paracoccaceae bacterium]